MRKIIQILLILNIAIECSGMEYQKLLPGDDTDKSNSAWDFFRIKKRPNDIEHRQSKILKALKNGTLSIEAMMNDLKAQRIDISHLPDVFFSYHSQEELKCSSAIKSNGFTPLMWLVMHTRDPYFFNLLFNSPVSSGLLRTINEKNSSGWTALMLAARNANTDSTEGTVKLLVDAGADLNLQDEEKRTALMLAARYANANSTEGTVKLLVDAGADLNLQEKDRKIFFCYRESKKEDMRLPTGSTMSRA